MFFSGLDLNDNRGICDPAMTSVPGIADEPGQTCLRTAHATFAVDHVLPLRCQVRRGAQDQEFLVSRAWINISSCVTGPASESERRNSARAANNDAPRSTVIDPCLFCLEL